MKSLTLLSFVSALLLGLLSCGVGGHSTPSGGFIGTGTPGPTTPTSSPGFVANPAPTPTPQAAQDSFVFTANFGDSTIGAALLTGSTGLFTTITGAPFPEPGQPSAVAATRDGKVLFVAHFATDTISAFNVRSDGTLSLLVPTTNACSATLATGTQPVKVAVHPNGTLVYTANQGSNNITAIRFDSIFNCMVLATGSPFTASGSVRSVAIDRTGSLLFAVTDIALSVFKIDSSNGALTLVSSNNFSSGTLLNVTTSPTADFVYVSDGNGNQIDVAAINTSTGTLTPLAASPFPVGGGPPSALAIDPLGKFLYSADSVSNQIAGFTIGSDGSLTQMLGSPFSDPNNPVDIAVDSSASFVVTANSSSGTIAAFSINTTGVLTPAGTFTIGSGAQSIAIVKKP
jgi:6-phosphogluconolactonase (cycloisomerase 2 family)